jgi:carboxymethylenebutenolidase
MSKLILIISLILTGSLWSWNLNPLFFKANPKVEPITHCFSDASDMKVFLDVPGFADLHPAPIPFDFTPQGEMINFPTADGNQGSGYFLPAKNKSNLWLFVYQEWWGLNDNIKQEAEKFHKDLREEVNVLALDMYDGKVANNPTDAAQYMRGTEESRLENIVKGASSFAGNQAQIANVGWCFGGSWSLKSALLLGNKNIGSVIYYGMPERNVEKLKTLNSDVLGLFATEQNINRTVIEEFAKNMKEAGKTLNYTIFSGPHGFANPSNPNHNPEQTEQAYAMAIGYLRNKFNQ